MTGWKPIPPQHKQKILQLKTLHTLAVLISATFITAKRANAQTQDYAVATGFVQVQQLNGSWWFIGPDGDTRN